MDYDKILKKLNILADAAKYDVSCSSSGSNRGGLRGLLGNTYAPGICHSFTPDGRCISLLKILLSNNCIYDCAYCPQRRSLDIERQSLKSRELCELIIEFYKRNYIEGLFLSSAIDKTPNHTMQQLTDTVIMLRKVYNFNGYIHLKGIPSADIGIINVAATFVDRMSFNIELPTEKSLNHLAPEKSGTVIFGSMKETFEAGAENDEDRRKSKTAPMFAPAGQSTQ
ncbi:MAG: radical SAM protein, partial [Firmicutes bacterium]|nr:radical SAM protein [Bacillota bacterium]